MTSGLPCINPVCDHTFSHADITSSTALTCPRCGNVIQLDASSVDETNPADRDFSSEEPKTTDYAPTEPLMELESRVPKAPLPLNNGTAATEEVPSAHPQPPLAVRVPTPISEGITDPDSIPMAAPSASAAAPIPLGDSRAVAEAAMQARRDPPASIWKKILLTVGLGSLLVGLPVVAIFSIYSYMHENTGDHVEGDVYNGRFYNQDGSLEKAFRIAAPYGAWKQNKGFKDLMKAAVALEREVINPDADSKDLVLLIVAGQDYGKREPRDAELLKQSIKRLEDCFGTRLEMTTEPEITQLDGKRALALYFRGELNSVEWIGTCYSLTYHGFGYSVFVAGTDPEVADELFAGLQKKPGFGFRIKTDRRGWKPRPPELVTYDGANAPIRIKGVKGQWKHYPNAQDIDEQGEIYLYSEDKNKYHKDHEKAAQILVLNIKKKTANLKEAMKAAREYVEGKKKEENSSFVISLASDQAKNEEGKAMPLGDEIGKVVELQMESDDPDYKRFVLLAVIHRPDYFYVVQCESFWQYRQAWRGDFYDVLSTFEARDNKK